VFLKKLVLGCFGASLILCGSCQKTNPTEPVKPNPGPTTQSDTLKDKQFGEFDVEIEGTRAGIKGKVYNGPQVHTDIYTQVMSSGPCKLLKHIIPVCKNDCPGARCVEGDTCKVEPDPVDVGKVTVTGITLVNKNPSFSMDQIGYNYSAMADDKFSFPPCTEGADISLSAPGSGTVPAFAINLKGITKLVVPNDSVQIPYLDHQPITLTWTAATKAGISRVQVVVNISYHGGTKALIDCDCEDNGTMTLPAAMLDSLKTFGISGFPRIEMTRIASNADYNTKIRLAMKSYVVLALSIPGVVSCNCPIGQPCSICPEGQVCGGEQRCIPK
jgi:hypothetical protein